MNTRRNFLKGAVIAGAMATPLFARGRRGGRGKRGGSLETSITEAQKAELLYIYQEEKVARDVYITLGKLYPDENTFASIQLSEQRHIDSAQMLCEKYGVDISGVNELEVGNFILPELQDLYDTCVAKGSESLIDALFVGEEIEITDIKDLEEAIEHFSGFNDVVNVFSNLREGSLNHLEAFQRAILREG